MYAICLSLLWAIDWNNKYSYKATSCWYKSDQQGNAGSIITVTLKKSCM